MIEAKNLVKMYGSHAAVDDLTFTVEEGKIVGFLGPNGAGKSTTMNMITGYIAATEGEILINGISMSDEPEKAKAHIGYLPELPPLYPDMRVREYLQFVAQLKKVKRAEREKHIETIMKQVKITDVSERLIKHLSKGYKQRVGLAGAMVGEPKILILDEPTVGLDPLQIIEIRELIKDLSKKHTVLLSSHIMQEISAVCDEIMIINNGKMIARDTPEGITSKLAHSTGLHLLMKASREKAKAALRTISGIKDVKYDEQVEEGMTGMTLYTTQGQDIREQVFYALANHDVPLYEMVLEQVTLEEAFLRLTQGGSKQHGGKKPKKGKKEKEEKNSEETQENRGAEEQTEEEKESDKKLEKEVAEDAGDL